MTKQKHIPINNSMQMYVQMKTNWKRKNRKRNEGANNT